jgi:ABC-type multidrug transport system fused ATPase/permease subunit
MNTLWFILLPNQRKAAFVMLALMLVGMLMETLGIGLVIPALALMTQGDMLSSQSALGRNFPEWLGNPTQVQLVIYGMLLLAIIYFLKTIFLAFLAWRQSVFVFGLEASLSQRLFNGYLRQPYTFHLQRNSAQLIQNSVNEVAQFSRGAVRSAMTLITELLVMMGISALLFVVEPVGASLVVAILGLTGFAFHKFSKARLMRWGRSRQYHEGMRIQHLQQGLGGAKDVKLLGREADFLSSYAFHCEQVAKVYISQSTLDALPRLWLEFLAVIGLVVLVISMLAQGKPIESLVPTIGLFAAAAFRLMPSTNRVLTTLQNLRYAFPVIDVIAREIALPVTLPSAAAAGNLSICKSIKIENVSYTYSDAAEPALRSINLEIEIGKSIGFIGGSGAGKSTLVDLILGLLTPNQGRLTIDGKDINEVLRAWQDQIGYVPQTIYLTDDTLRRNIAFGLAADQIDDLALNKAIEAAQLLDFVATLPEGLNTVVGERGVRLSGGQRQRIGIARALYHDPAVLVLDEATSSLDIATERDVMQAVNALQGDKTILIVAHRLSTVEHCDTIVRLERGEVVQVGTPRQILTAYQEAPNSLADQFHLSENLNVT